MHSHDFVRKLQKLNPTIRVWWGSCDTRSAGLYYIKNREYENICGIDKGDTPKFCVFNPKTNVLKKSGWLRVLDICVNKRLLNRRATEELFHTRVGWQKYPKELSDYTRAWNEAVKVGIKESIKKSGRPVEGYMRWQDIIDIHRMKGA